MKKKIMAFLLAATMVVGSATSASAVNLGINGINADKTTANDAAFQATYFSFKDATNTNLYTAAWASQTDATSKGIISAWQTAKKAQTMTTYEKIWETQGRYDMLGKKLDQIKDANGNGIYGEWVSGAWDKTVYTEDNLKSINYTGLVAANVFANNSSIGTNIISFRPTYGVILQSSVEKVQLLFNKADSMTNVNSTAEERSAAWFDAKNAVETLVTYNTTWANANTNEKIFAFVKYTTKAKTYSPVEQGIVSGYTDIPVREMKNDKGQVMVYGKNTDQTWYSIEVVSPLEAIYTHNVATDYINAGLVSNFYSGQAVDLYEVIIGTESLEDGNFPTSALDAGKSAGANDLAWVPSWMDPNNDYDVDTPGYVGNGAGNAFKNVRLWRWNNQYSRAQYIEDLGVYTKAKTEVDASWNSAVSADIVAAYNAAAEKAGLSTLNAGAQVGDIYYMDITATKVNGGKFTLLYGKVAKELTDKAKAVKVLHWTGKEWKAVDAEKVTLYSKADPDSYGILVTENSYSPFLFFEVTDEGEVVDATAEAAKTPEKSGKTGVSFLGL